MQTPRSSLGSPGRFGLARGWHGPALLALSISLYAAVSLLIHQPFHAGGMALRYFDLRIYRLGAIRVTHGAGLYGTPMLHHLGFTYPPFAALVMAPLAWFPARVDELGVTALNLGLLVFALRRALMLAGRPVRAPWGTAAAFAAAALWLEPVSVTLGYGQINLLITALVLFDLSRPDTARSKGLAIGIAAAIKLTPLLFIAYLLFSRRGRAAACAALAFLGSIALSFAVLPGTAATYWFHKIFQTGRIGNPIGVPNQSLHGTVARLTGAPQPTFGWELVVVAIVLGGLALAVRASRRGDEAAGYSLAALSTLLASPISWSHHWTLAVPALALLGARAWDQRSRRLLVATAALALAGFAYLPEIAEGSFHSARGPASLFSTNPYPLLGVLVLAACAATVLAPRWRAVLGVAQTASAGGHRLPSGAH